MIYEEIEYPKFKQMSNFIGEDTTVSQFLEEVKDILFNTIYLDSNFYNVVLYRTSYKIEEADEVIKELADGKPIRYYNLECYTKINCVEAKFLITNNIEIIGKFDLLYMHENSSINRNIYNKFGTTTLVYKIKFSPFKNIVNLTENLSITNYEELEITEKNMEILESDIRMKDLVCKKKISFIKSLDVAIEKYVSEATPELKILDKQKTNILVLCANNTSIKREKYKIIMKKLLGTDVSFENADVYFLGKDIAKETAYITRASLYNVTCNDKFDVIIIEHCFYEVAQENLELIRSFLDERGMIITPNYSKVSFSDILDELGMIKIIRGEYIGLINEKN